jgi:hypothetical protein
MYTLRLVQCFPLLKGFWVAWALRSYPTSWQMYTGLSVDAVSSRDIACATRHNHPDTSRSGTRKKAQTPRYFPHRHVKESTNIQILHAQACERKQNHPDTSRTGTWKKAQTSRYFTHRQVKESTLPRYFTHRHAKESKTTQILHAQARERKHKQPDTFRTGM